MLSAQFSCFVLLNWHIVATLYKMLTNDQFQPFLRYALSDRLSGQHKNVPLPMKIQNPLTLFNTPHPQPSTFSLVKGLGCEIALEFAICGLAVRGLWVK